MALFNEKARLLVRGQRETLSRAEAKDLKGCVWFHAASVGEFEQARPLIERIKKDHPKKKVVVTFFSPSGYEMRKDYALADGVFYLPFATKRNARRLLDVLQPEKAIFVKYEYWPAYLRELKRREIPTYIIDALFRERQPFFRFWGTPYRRLLNCFSIIFVQDEESRALLDRYGIRNSIVAGDTRFDRVNEICSSPKEVQEVERFIDPPLSPLTNKGGGSFSMLSEDSVPDYRPKVIVAGSTWPDDERLLELYVRTHADVRLIVVPHELTDEHIHFIFNLFEGRYVRLSEATPQNVTAVRTLLVDKMGLLSSLYRYATVAYVGGGFGAGIHNTIEPAVFGVPVLFGPNNGKFREAQDMLRNGAARTFSNYKEFELAMDEALANHNAIGKVSRDYVQSELGAGDEIYKALFK